MFRCTADAAQRAAGTPHPHPPQHSDVTAVHYSSSGAWASSSNGWNQAPNMSTTASSGCTSAACLLIAAFAYVYMGATGWNRSVMESRVQLAGDSVDVPARFAPCNDSRSDRALSSPISEPTGGWKWPNQATPKANTEA
jgi:hypothetical protein